MRGPIRKSRRRAAAVLSGLLLAAGGASASAAPVAVSFEAATPAGGDVVYAVFASEAGWRSRKAPVASGKLRWSGVPVMLHLDLSPGRYAVMAYHDRNANGRLDMIPLGPPTEPYGFTGPNRGLFGAPPWKDAAVTLDGQPAALRVRLR